MSLDFYLTTKETRKVKSSGIFIRENGETKEISVKEWNEKFPNRKPVKVTSLIDEYETNTVFDKNITHNLVQMANKAGVYYALWRPEEKGWKHAGDIVPALEKGLKKLLDKPEVFKKMNPDNGWGSYENLVSFVESTLEACKEYPLSIITVSR